MPGEASDRYEQIPLRASYLFTCSFIRLQHRCLIYGLSCCLLLHHSHIVNIVGPSYQTNDVLEKLEESKKKEYDAT